MARMAKHLHIITAYILRMYLRTIKKQTNREQKPNIRINCSYWWMNHTNFTRPIIIITPLTSTNQNQHTRSYITHTQKHRHTDVHTQANIISLLTRLFESDLKFKWVKKGWPLIYTLIHFCMATIKFKWISSIRANRKPQQFNAFFYWWNFHLPFFVPFKQKSVYSIIIWFVGCTKRKTTKSNQ